MFGKSKKNEVAVVDQKKKKNSFKKLYAGFMAACMMLGSSAISCSAAEAGDVSTITSDTVTTVTSTMSSLWTMITSNAYLSFGVGVSVVLAVIMIFKRLIGASRR